MFLKNRCVIFMFFIISTYFHFNNAFIGTWNRINGKNLIDSDKLSLNNEISYKLRHLYNFLRTNDKSLLYSKLNAAIMDDLDSTVESGPLLSDKKRKQVEGFVKSRGGKRPIQRVLIANNGMAATKSILSLRQWAYVTFGDDHAIEFVAMATREDLNANAEFVRLADAFVEVPGGPNKNNYANVDLIIDIAVSQKVDGVWPGWGHASENPRLPAGLKANGIQFIGPTSHVMAALGDKVSANILAQTAQVPSIPWSGDGITSELNDDGVIPPEVFNSACIFNVEEAAETANKIGYPVMIKASEGGGGKGIRMANDEDELRTNFVQVVNEVPGSPVFMMQLCTQARHLEVQIVGDEYGNAVALNGRDCSTQRRFQKIFEEGPPTIAKKDTFRQMELSAQRLTKTIGYIGAGTVEYLYNAAEDKYYFLELNPRLQVEHPVTEGLTNVNLPSVQLQVAMGIPLHRIPEIRDFYGRDRDATDEIDFMSEEYKYPENHVIAARITAENPDEGFKPTSGRIERVKFQSTPRVWGYFSVGANGGIHEYADSQFGHLFASGPTREDARKSLVLALKEIEVRGDIRTTVEYLIQLLETEEFKQNTIDTSWLDGLIREKSVSVPVEPHAVSLGAAVFRAHSMVQQQINDLKDALGKGQTSLMSIPGFLNFPIEVTYEDIKYSFDVSTQGPNAYRLTVKPSGQVMEVNIREQPDESLLCSINGETYKLFGQEEALGLRMRINGVTVMIPTIYNPSELRSDVTGKVVRYLQQDGDTVNQDEPYVEVEAMKMIMALKSGESGKINHALSPGSIISAGDMIATLSLKDPSKVKQIGTFNDRLTVVSKRPEMDVEEAGQCLNLAVDGYEHDHDAVLSTYLSYSDSADESVPFLTSLIDRFVGVETQFQGTDPDALVGDLAKANKDNLDVIIPQLIAHKQLKYRTTVLLAVLRQIEALLSKVPTDQYTEVSIQLRQSLSALAELSGDIYGEVALKAKQIIDFTLLPPFEERLNNLAAALKGETNLIQLSQQPNLAVSVDLLTVLMAHEDSSIRVAAMEVYIRRIYRADELTELSIKEVDGALTASWKFAIRNTEGTSGLNRRGFAAVFNKPITELSASMPTVLDMAQPILDGSSASEPVNTLHVGFVQNSGVVADQDAIASSAAQILAGHATNLKKMAIRSVNLFQVEPGEKVYYYNHKASDNFNENPNIRNMRPTMPGLLEINRLLDNHDIVRMPTLGRNSQLYFGTEKSVPGVKRRGIAPQVLFLRSISHSPDTTSFAGAERALLMAMDELDRARLDPRVSATTSSRLFLNVIPDSDLDLATVVDAHNDVMEGMIAKYATRLLNLRVDEIEVKLRCRMGNEVVPLRLISSSSSGGWLSRDAYREYIDPITGQTVNYCTVSASGEDDVCILDPYPTSSALQQKRAAARRIGSTYAHDFLGLMEVALISSWQQYIDTSTNDDVTMPKALFSSEELVLNTDGELTQEKRFPGSNKIGMLAWLCTMKTPQYPEGREVVVIANDVTLQSGSFGVLEDEFFYKASEYARTRGLPRVFISCNSGARIGLVEDLKPKYKVQWKDANNPTLGFDYLYLSEQDYNSLKEGTVEATPKKDLMTGETHYVLDAIIGQIHGIGVENLRGSGLIAGETSRAYDETFTLSYVTGRSVGIGAYLNRLGQRVIQMEQGPMILTGYSALNKLLGKEVYTSQDQLGGPQIMYPNGVTHEVVENDKEGMQAVLDWINFTPKYFSSSCAELKGAEDPSREIEFTPTKTPYDPRHMLAGTTNTDGSFVSGFLDRDSFKEYMGGWGKSVIAGRGRLGGLNVGVIAVETRLVQQRIPADPGNPDSREALLPQAGQVWYPDSAYKTAQAIQDFNRGENLPLIIFANWRGFSGGTRDMYGEILKFGAMIVDALRQYKHPVFIYIPPNGELRGGAWVVIDPTINPGKMEMYADKDSRGGILEPPGICEVKYRKPDQLSTAHRLDPVLNMLDEELAAAISNSEIERIQSEITARENMLAPLYLQVAHEFADLHDRAGRMKAKDCIRDVLEWKTSRNYFYWRIKRRILEDKFKDDLVSASNNDMTLVDAAAKLASVLPNNGDISDEEAVKWLESNESTVNTVVKNLRLEKASSAVSELLNGLSKSEIDSILGKL